MAVKQLNKDEWTKDGRKWVFYDYVKNIDGTRRKYKSKKYFTKNEALAAEREFLTENSKSEFNNANITFKELCNLHYEYQKDKVKITTLNNYKKRLSYLKSLDNIKVKDLNINHYELWKKEINSKNLATRTKNDLYKYLKSVLNYGTRWYSFTYNNMYSKMVNFNNPNELPKEMQYYTYEEFKQFISCEDDLMFKTLFEVLYYCGLRRGEIRGLAWEDINLENQTIYINKNIVAVKNDDKNYTISTPKTKKSKRQIPLTPSLTEHLKELYEISKKHYGFSSKWFVFGDTDPITNGRIRYRKNKIAKLAKVKQIRLHDFRHSCASLLINNGASVTLVANYLGHSKIEETLETYSHLFKSKLDELVNIIDNLN